MDELLELIEREINPGHVGPFYKTVDWKRPIKIVGFHTQIDLREPAPGDPFYETWAKHLAEVVPETMCGPAISNTKLALDPRPFCDFTAPDTSRCRFSCAPMFTTYYQDVLQRAYAPCHAKESPSCCAYASFCPSETCTMLKAWGCHDPNTAFPNYYIAYSILDLTADEYTVDTFGLQADGKELVKANLGIGYTKTKTDIFYGYILIQFAYTPPPQPT